MGFPVGPFALYRPVEERTHALVDLLAEARDLALRYARAAHGLHEVVHRVRDVHVEDRRAAEQPLDVVGEAEDPGTVGGLVGADALEHAHAVVERVGEDVDPSVVPVDELAVHPDLLGGGDGHVGFVLLRVR